MSPQATRRRSIRLEAVPSPSSTGSPPAFPSPQNSTPDDSQENSQNVVADLLLKYAPAPDNKGAMMQMMHPAHAALLRSPGKLAKMKGKASSTKSTIGYQALKGQTRARSTFLSADGYDRTRRWFYLTRCALKPFIKSSTPATNPTSRARFSRPSCHRWGV